MIINKVLGGRKTAQGGAYNVQQTINGDNCEIDINSADHAVIQSKSVEITKDGANVIKPDDGFNAMSSVNVNVNVKNPIEEYVKYILVPSELQNLSSYSYFEGSDNSKYFIGGMGTDTQYRVYWVDIENKELVLAAEGVALTRFLETSDGLIFAWCDWPSSSSSETSNIKYGIWKFNINTHQFDKIFNYYKNYWGYWYSSDGLIELENEIFCSVGSYNSVAGSTQDDVGTYRYDRDSGTFILVTDDHGVMYYKSYCIYNNMLFGMSSSTFGGSAGPNRFRKWNSETKLFEIVQNDIALSSGAGDHIITEANELYYSDYMAGPYRLYKYDTNENKLKLISGLTYARYKGAKQASYLWRDSTGNVYFEAHMSSTAFENIYIIEVGSFEAKLLLELTSSHIYGMFESSKGIFFRFNNDMYLYKSDKTLIKITTPSPGYISGNTSNILYMADYNNVIIARLEYKVVRFNEDNNSFEEVLVSRSSKITDSGVYNYPNITWGTADNYTGIYLTKNHMLFNDDIWFTSGTICRYDKLNNTLYILYGSGLAIEYNKNIYIIRASATINSPNISLIAKYNYDIDDFILAINTTNWNGVWTCNTNIRNGKLYLMTYENDLGRCPGELVYDSETNIVEVNDYYKTQRYWQLKTGNKLYFTRISPHSDYIYIPNGDTQLLALNQWIFPIMFRSRLYPYIKSDNIYLNMVAVSNDKLIVID